MSHWYGRTECGLVIPVYTMPNASSGGTRSIRVTDVRKAKKEGFKYLFHDREYVVLDLLPSVTTITSILAKPALEEWKIRRAIEEAFNMPAVGDEALDSYHKAVTSKAFAITADSAEFGTKIHSAMENCLTGQSITDQPIELRPFIKPALDWIETEGLTDFQCEMPVAAAKTGYAGLVDCVCKKGDQVVILDFKTKKTQEDKSIFHSTDYKMQLAAYAYAVTGDVSKARCYNLFISSTEVGRFDVIEINDLDKWAEAFKSLCNVFNILKGI